MKILQIDKAAGPDGIPPIFYKRCCVALTHPLYMIFNKSLTTSTFPSLWKLHIVENYRPISKQELYNS